jgi:hypothetical protein
MTRVALTHSFKWVSLRNEKVKTSRQVVRPAVSEPSAAFCTVVCGEGKNTAVAEASRHGSRVPTLLVAPDSSWDVKRRRPGGQFARVWQTGMADCTWLFSSQTAGAPVLPRSGLSAYRGRPSPERDVLQLN